MPRPPLSRLAVAALVSLAPAMPLVIAATGGGQAAAAAVRAIRGGRAPPRPGAVPAIPRGRRTAHPSRFPTSIKSGQPRRDGQAARPLVVWDSGAAALLRRSLAASERASDLLGRGRSKMSPSPGELGEPCRARPPSSSAIRRGRLTAAASRSPRIAAMASTSISSPSPAARPSASRFFRVMNAGPRGRPTAA